MAKAAQKTTLSPSRDMPFDKLVLSQSNVERHVARGRSGRVLLPGLAVFAGRNGGNRPMCRDGRVTGAGVVGAIRCDDADGLIARDLVQQVGQHGRIADPAAGYLDRPELHCLRIDAEVNLAPVPWLGGPVFPGQPLAIASAFTPVLSIRRCSAPELAR